MVAAVGFDLSSLVHAVSSGAGKVAAALAVAALAYLIFAAALWLMRSGADREKGSDVSGFVLIATLAAYVVVGLLLDALWFGLLSAGLIGLALLAVFAGEVRSVASRFHHHAHGH
jgi:hypothetical protein